MRRFAAFLAVFLIFFALPGGDIAMEKLQGAWEGAISVMGRELGIIVRFDESGGILKGTIAIPMQMAADLPLSNLKREGERIHFELESGPGVAVFDGLLKKGNITGEFTQAGIKGSFRLLKAGEKALKPAAVPQQIARLPYTAEEVVLKSGAVRLTGTLTLPEGKGPFPAVILITGSGTQNRDEEVFGFKIFGIIADHWTRKGIAVLRCDDRGLGSPQAARNARSLDFALDAAAQVEYLLTRDEIAKDGIGLFGHSEGAIIAPLANLKRPCDFMVLMAGTAVKGREVLIEQIALIARADGASQTEVDRALSEQKRAYELLDMPNGEKEIEKMIAEQVRENLARMTPEQRQAVADPEALIRSATAEQLAALRSPWFRYFLDFDPAPSLAMVKCPVLAIFGEKDTQVSSRQNMPAMAMAFQKGGNRDVTFKVFPDANHLFQKAKTGSPSEYASLEKAFVPGFLETISSWILEKTKRYEK